MFLFLGNYSKNLLKLKQSSFLTVVFLNFKSKNIYFVPWKQTEIRNMCKYISYVRYRVNTHMWYCVKSSHDVAHNVDCLRSGRRSRLVAPGRVNGT